MSTALTPVVTNGNSNLEQRLAAIGVGGGNAPSGDLDLIAAGLVGDGTTDDSAALAAFVTTQGSTVCRVRVRKTHMLRSTVTLPSTMDLIIEPGAGFSSDNASVLRVRSGVTAARYQWVFGSLALSFIGPTDVGLVTSLNRPDVYPEWWGAAPYQNGAPVDVTTGFAAMNAAIAPFYGAGKNATNASGWTTANVRLGAGVYRVSAGVGQAAISPPYSSRGFTMTGAGIQRTFIECNDGAGVAKATPAMCMLDLNGQFFARLEHLSIGGVSGKGNYTHGIYYHRNATTSALGSSQLTVRNVEVTAPWINAAWKFGSDLTYDPNNSNQVDNVVSKRLMAHRNTGYANDGYCLFGVAQGVGVTTNTLNFSHDGLDILGCAVGLLHSATNGRVTNAEMGNNDIDIQLNQNTVTYFEVNGLRSEGSRKAIDGIASNWSYASNIAFRNCLWQLTNLANDPTDGTPDWAKLAATGTWTLENIEVSAIANSALQPTLRIANASLDKLTLFLNGVRIQYATRGTWLIYDATQGSSYSVIDAPRVDFLDVNATAIDSIGLEGRTMLAKSGTAYLRRMGTWWGQGNDAHGPDAGVGRVDVGIAGSPNFLAHTLSVVPIGTKLQAPHVSTTDPTGGTNYLVALVGYDGAGNQSLKGPNAASIQCVAEASLSLTHNLTVTLEDNLSVPTTGNALAVTYDVIYSVDGGTTWKVVAARQPYATLTMNPVVIKAAGGAYTLPTTDATGTLRLGNTASATTPGTVAAKFPIYNASGTLVGYVPIYTTIT